MKNLKVVKSWIVCGDKLKLFKMLGLAYFLRIEKYDACMKMGNKSNRTKNEQMLSTKKKFWGLFTGVNPNHCSGEHGLNIFE